MKTHFLSVLTGIALFPFFNVIVAQTSASAPALGAATDFALFTASGAVQNNGPTVVLGDLGADAGLITGFPPGIITGTKHAADPTTAQANLDVQAAYFSLAGQHCDSTLNSTTGLGNHQVLKPYVYCISTATTLTDTLFLDGENDRDALFIFQIDGVLSTSAASRIVLINSARLSNVYFQIHGAFNLGIESVFKGTVVADGAINLSRGATLLGRGLSTSDAINLDSNTVILASFVLPVSLTSFSAAKEGRHVRVAWSTATEQNSKDFVVERSSSAQETAWKAVGVLPATGGSTSPRQYSLVDDQPTAGANYYRLRSNDLDGAYTFSQVSAVCFDGGVSAINAFPNPLINSLTVTGAPKGSSIIIMDIAGKTLLSQPAAGTGLDQLGTAELKSGTYLLKIADGSSRMTYIRVIK